MAITSFFKMTTSSFEQKEAAGVEAIFLEEENVKFKVTSLLKKQDSFILDKTLEITYVDELLVAIKKKTPIVLTLSGIGILHRKIEDASQQNTVSAFSKLFPSANLREFYVQRTIDSKNNSAFLSVIRKNQCDQLLAKLSGFKIIKLLIGPFAMNRLIPLIQSNGFAKERLTVHHYTLTLSDGNIENLSWSKDEAVDETVKLGEEKVPIAQLVAYASAITYFLPEQTIVEANVEPVSAAKKEFEYERKFKTGGVIAASFFFLMLLINFFVFNNYYSKAENLRQQLLVNSDLITDMDSLTGQLNSKKRVLENFSAQGFSKTSYYADLIASTVPASVTLEELNLFPVKKNNSSDEELLFDNKKIIVSGNCQVSIDLNEWLKRLQQENWVKKINILSFNQTGVKQKGEFSFQIDLQ